MADDLRQHHKVLFHDGLTHEGEDSPSVSAGPNLHEQQIDCGGDIDDTYARVLEVLDLHL